ncbi:hypothetical protein JCM21714_2082 [Gracilibacillus boraciitolerans JCM 21714]|uniref:TcpE family protein n=1 Tax=Gracilibacillus boraciitolerans JCM 21714 TaxID=1298598 RepID=W4VJQ2_9BACI|nr:TcpE family conjugal transfer membrane protein [Gracilibacillus boraciitolerans]GAE93048.1 hypothetical protein JCM21714_2082 [Gracilibacillus boraciitolerans JCM 21714]
MANNTETKIPLYVLNDYLKFERKIYQLFGLSLGRPIPLKTILYFLTIVVIEIVLYFTPILGSLINWMPAVFLIMIPFAIAYVLSDVVTEGRLPLQYFRSILLYYWRKQKGITYARGREVKKLMRYEFEGYTTITFGEDHSNDRFKPKKSKFKSKGMPKVTYIKDQLD